LACFFSAAQYLQRTDFLMDLLSSAAMGLAAVCFWQKDFVINDLWLVTVLLIGGAVPSLALVIAAALSLAIVLVHESNSVRKLKSAFLKNWRMFMLVWALFSLCHRSVLTEFRHFSMVAWVSGCVQFLREPVQLKLRLREWRIAAGPIYTMAASWSFVQYVRFATTRAGASIAVVGGIAAVVASFVLRPDNQELDRHLLRWLPNGPAEWPTAFSTRARYHGILMMLSMVLLTLLLLAEGELLLVWIFFLLLLMDAARRITASQAVALGSMAFRPA